MGLRQEWRSVFGFDNYYVSNTGDVRNNLTQRVLTPFVNQLGFSYVCLYQDGRQFKKGISRLVAEAFIPVPDEPFDTPINLDGDRLNNDIRNLMWRPRWFAVKYNQQFNYVTPQVVVQEVETLDVFENPLEAAITFGLLAMEIKIAAWNFTHHPTATSRVWPTGQQFRELE